MPSVSDGLIQQKFKLRGSITDTLSISVSTSLTQLNSIVGHDDVYNKAENKKPTYAPNWQKSSESLLLRDSYISVARLTSPVGLLYRLDSTTTTVQFDLTAFQAAPSISVLDFIVLFGTRIQRCRRRCWGCRRRRSSRCSYPLHHRRQFDLTAFRAAPAAPVEMRARF